MPSRAFSQVYSSDCSLQDKNENSNHCTYLPFCGPIACWEVNEKYVLTAFCDLTLNDRNIILIHFILLNPERNTRIVGGVDAAEGEAPYQCSLQWGQYHMCGCAIINKSWVITAAHCLIDKKPANLQVLVGTNNLKKGGTRYKVSKLYKHNKYDGFKQVNDIGLIRINGTIAFNTLVQPIKYSKEEVKPNSVVQLSKFFI